MRSNRLKQIASVVLALVLLAGCASVPKDAGFNDVKNAVADRGGPRVQWHQQSPEDQAVDEAVRRLTQNELTADEAAQVALLNNRRLQATFEELGIAQADLVEAGLLKNPVFSIEARFPGRALEADVFQDVLDVFVLPLRKRVAESQFAAAKLRVTNSVLDLWSQTRLAFYELQAAGQMLELRRSIAQATEASADAARKLHDAGNIKDLDYANEQAMYEQARIERRGRAAPSACASSSSPDVPEALSSAPKPTRPRASTPMWS